MFALTENIANATSCVVLSSVFTHVELIQLLCLYTQTHTHTDRHLA